MDLPNVSTHKAEVYMMLTQREHPRHKRQEYCLVSTVDPNQVLQWFGTKRPSERWVNRVEKRVQYFKHKGKE